MIVEMRTSTLKARTTPKFEAAYAASRADNSALQQTGVIWKTIAGPLNQVIELIPYAGYPERAAATGMAPGCAGWPLNLYDLVEEQESRIIVPAPFSPPLKIMPDEAFFEMRTYTFRGGNMAEVIDRWSEVIAPRVKLSRLIIAGFTDIGPLHEWTHIWSYRDFAEREKVREAARASGLWPPETSPFRQRNVFMESANSFLARDRPL